MDEHGDVEIIHWLSSFLCLNKLSFCITEIRLYKPRSTGANSHRRPNKENRSTYLTENVWPVT